MFIQLVRVFHIVKYNYVVRFSWQMNVFMLREILYEETYDKSPSDYSKIRERGEGRKSTRAYGQKIRQTSPWGGSVGQQIPKSHPPTPCLILNMGGVLLPSLYLILYLQDDSLVLVLSQLTLCCG